MCFVCTSGDCAAGLALPPLGGLRRQQNVNAEEENPRAENESKVKTAFFFPPRLFNLANESASRRLPASFSGTGAPQLCAQPRGFSGPGPGPPAALCSRPPRRPPGVLEVPRREDDSSWDTSRPTCSPSRLRF